jgi:hypothetical protein
VRRARLWRLGGENQESWIAKHYLHEKFSIYISENIKDQKKVAEDFAYRL